MDTSSFVRLKEKIKNEDQNAYLKPYISVGDFTYGIPTIYAWDDKTKLNIGKFCSIAANVTILLGGEHNTDWCTTYPFNCLLDTFNYITGHPKSKGDIFIGNDVWLGNGVKIMSGVTIGDGAVIGANALITKDVPSYSIVGGTPANIIGKRFRKRDIKKFEIMKWWDWELGDILEAVPLLQSSNVEELWKFYKLKLKEKRKK